MLLESLLPKPELQTAGTTAVTPPRNRLPSLAEAAVLAGGGGLGHVAPRPTDRHCLLAVPTQRACYRGHQK